MDLWHMLQLLLPATYGDYEFGWQKLYGPVYRLKGCFGQDRLMVSDAVALQYILNSPDFTYGATLETAVYMTFGKKSLMGPRVCFALPQMRQMTRLWRIADHNHKRLRAALNVGFTAAAVRNYLAVFEKTAQTLTEQLEDTSEVPTDMCPLLSFLPSAHHLGLSRKGLGSRLHVEELSDRTPRFQPVSSTDPRRLHQHTLTYLVGRAAVHIPSQTIEVLRATKRLAEALGAQVVREKTDAAQVGLEIDTDLYAQLVDRHRSDENALTEDEIIAQTGMILAAGQDTTTNTLAFGLWELARAPELQEKLRAEIHSIAIPLAERMAVRDTVIPLADPISTSTGESLSHIHVRKGQGVSLAIASYHRQESRWGEGAHEFNPFRRLNGKTTQGDALGPYATLLSFLGGPRTCLGWRFALLEMQVFICELVGKFSFTHQRTTGSPPKGAPLFVKRIV
ncbi:cytochrome P450 [Mycena leptocephala]|nr:cytochrome P450 [Mycena leptocephala]